MPSEKNQLKLRVKKIFSHDYEVLFLEKKPDEFTAHAIDVRKKIGKGSHGCVYAAYPIDLATMTLDKSKLMAAKKIMDIRTFNINEVKFFRRFYKNSDFGTIKSDAYVLMDYLPGSQLYTITKDGSASLSSAIKKLNFSQRIQLIWNIMLSVNLMHHDTPSTGGALIHSDLNGTNIIADINPDTNTFDAYLLDFAVASDINDDPDEIKSNQPMEGSMAYMPCEILSEKRGIKSDIYALAPVFLIILGAKHPFSYKAQHFFLKKDYYESSYCFDGIFTGYDVPRFEPNVLSYLRGFIGQMQQKKYADRPDSDTTLRFFTTLNNFCKCAMLGREDNTNYVRAATLALLAKGMGMPAYLDADLDAHIQFCKDVLNCSRLTAGELEGLLQKHCITKPLLSCA